MSADQADFWGRAAERYEEEFISLDGVETPNPIRVALSRLAGAGAATVADLGCGPGALLPFLAENFRRVLAIDFAEPMLHRARRACAGRANVAFRQSNLSDLSAVAEKVDVAVAVNSLVMPDIDELEKSLQAIHGLLRPGGTFLGVVPSMDGQHYLTMLLMDRARQTGMPLSAARKNAALHAEHELFDFAFGEFRYRGLVQHFWQGFEVTYRLERAGFHKVKVRKAPLSWQQCACGNELAEHPPPWDWYFEASRPAAAKSRRKKAN